MTPIDWLILVFYILFIIGLSWWVGSKQKNQEDYYIGGKKMPAWQIALSIMATQVSAISLIGAPAFVAYKIGGGLFWLQYEFAIPLAMIAIMFILVPVFHQKKIITIYEFIEETFGEKIRIVLSVIFLISRGLGSGVALLATGIVTAVLLGLPLYETILLIGVVSIVYTTFGGIKADIYSDIIQLVILWAGTFVAIGVILGQLDVAHLTNVLQQSPRMKIFQVQSTGLGDGNTFSFWAMLIGGFFLYFSYYGCDQSQAQRLLTTATPEEAQKALLYNGIFRFFLVLTYLFLGVLFIPFLKSHPNFSQQMSGKQADFLVPTFLIHYFPKGLLGFLVAGIFAASMSSIDSALNSLSAATYRDILLHFFPSMQKLSAKREMFVSRILTILWGGIATGFALSLIGGNDTVIELVNKIGSAFYGPILGMFILAIFSRYKNAPVALLALVAGVFTNIILWQYFSKQVSWMWWNAIGFFMTFLSYLFFIRLAKKKKMVETNISLSSVIQAIFHNAYARILILAFLIFLLIALGLELLF